MKSGFYLCYALAVVVSCVFAEQAFPALVVGLTCWAALSLYFEEERTSLEALSWLGLLPLEFLVLKVAPSGGIPTILALLVGLGGIALAFAGWPSFRLEAGQVIAYLLVGAIFGGWFLAFRDTNELVRLVVNWSGPLLAVTAIGLCWRGGKQPA